LIESSSVPRGSRHSECDGKQERNLEHAEGGVVYMRRCALTFCGTVESD